MSPKLTLQKRADGWRIYNDDDTQVGGSYEKLSEAYIAAANILRAAGLSDEELADRLELDTQNAYDCTGAES